MAQTLSLTIQYEGSEKAKKQFIWYIIQGDDLESDKQSPDDFESLEELLDFAKEIEGENLNIPQHGLSDIYIADFNDRFIAIEAEDDYHYELLMEIVDMGAIGNVGDEDITVNICLDGEYICGREYFKYQNGNFVEQWFMNDRRDSGLWSPCRISWKGSKKATQAFLDDITGYNEGDNSDILFEKDEQRWIGRHLNFDKYYDEAGPYMRCSICDDEIADDHVSFDIYCDDFDEKEPVVEMFDAIAAAHPDLEFKMQVCSINSDKFEWTKFFAFKNGECADKRKSEDKKDKLDFSKKENFLRFSLLENLKGSAKGDDDDND